MDIEANLRGSLVSKFDLLKRRSLAVVCQLSDRDVVWAPNDESNSIANLAVHIRETVRHRVEAPLLHAVGERDRDREFSSSLVLDRQGAIAALQESFDVLIRVVDSLSDEQAFLRQPFLDDAPSQSALQRESTVLDLCLQMLAHLSEHVGQILYIAKARLDARYVTTTFAKKRG